MNVNILMSSYNGEKYIADQIKSIQNQTYSDWKLIVRDDGSKDATCDIVEQFVSTDSRIKLVKTNNVGVIASFFELTKMETADFYFFADQDDIWLPDKLQVVLAEAKQHDNEQPILYYTDLKIVDQDLKVLNPSMIRFQSDHANTKLVQELTENTVTGGTMAANHALIGKWTSTKDVIMHDWWLAVLAAGLGELVYIDKPTELYRQHENNVLGARTLSKRMKNWFNHWLKKYWWLINSSQKQARKLLAFDGLSKENQTLAQDFVSILEQPLPMRVSLLKKHHLRKNKTLHTIIFRTLIVTKLGYKKEKQE